MPVMLKGICNDDILVNYMFDTEYYPYGTLNGRIYFRCHVKFRLQNILFWNENKYFFSTPEEFVLPTCFTILDQMIPARKELVTG